ncbi:MAG: aspartate dehydrogenase [Candidatus Omnitrophica bacterium]|nr:aspartate dehydrogenase [Candidatus Omnitrophota bacterium]
MKKKIIGIVGCGAIGSSLAKAIVKDFAKEAKLCGLYDLDKHKAEILSRKLSARPGLAVESLGRIIRESELVIEAASAKVSWNIARAALSRGKDVMLMSVGGVSGRLRQLRVLAGKNNSRVYIPSGAISGIDAVKAAHAGRIDKVILTTTKNPLSFKGVKYIASKGINLDKIKKETVLFSGKARDAVKYFPQNINVAAVLSLAGVGESKTLVKIIASPGISRNTHEVRVVSPAANIFTRTENVLHPDNPKTSFLAVLSAVAMLRHILEPVVIGT